MSVEALARLVGGVELEVVIGDGGRSNSSRRSLVAVSKRLRASRNADLSMAQEGGQDGSSDCERARARRSLSDGACA